MSTSPRRIKIAHLYPEVMDLYGDGGNVIALQRRCEWRGIEVETLQVHVGKKADLRDVELIVMGGGQDTAQVHVAHHLVERGDTIRELVDSGTAALVVCGAFQLFGRSYTTASGVEMEGLGVFDARTVANSQRLVGNVETVVRLQRWGAAHAYPPQRLVGFENHSGRTFLAPGAQPLGRVLSGAGNSGDGMAEGAVYRNAIGTYLHGPVLPKNPALADHLIMCALAHRTGRPELLLALDDGIEMQAHRMAASRCAAETP